MSRTKAPYSGKVEAWTSTVFVTAVDATEGENFKGRVPAIRGYLPDGRAIFLTFENTRKPVTTRDEYTQNMRRTANAILAEASRRESDPAR